MTIGIDPHKQTHTAAAVDEVGMDLAHQIAPAEETGSRELLAWALGVCGPGSRRHSRPGKRLASAPG